MPDPGTDDDAFTWAGDEQEITRPVARAARPSGADRSGAGSLVVLGVFGGIALLETVGWVRGVLSATLEATLEPGAGPLGSLAFGVNVAGRVLAVAAPLLWFTLAAIRIHGPVRRSAWLALGALLLLPWPALLGLL